jgi:excisionase family DNA binding protein
MAHTALDGNCSAASEQPTIAGLNPLPMLLTPAEAAHQLSLSRYTIYSMVKSGQLRGRRYGRLVLIHRDELQRFAASLEKS